LKNIENDSIHKEYPNIDMENEKNDVHDFNVAKELQENEDYFLALKYYNEAPKYEPTFIPEELVSKENLEDGAGVFPDEYNDDEISEEIPENNLLSPTQLQNGLMNYGSNRVVVNSALSYLLNEDLNNYEANLAIAEMLGDVNKGLNEKELNKLPSFQYNGSPISENNCSICICEWEIGQQLKKLNCSHTFHEDCLNQWLKKKKSCPLCLKNVDV